MSSKTGPPAPSPAAPPASGDSERWLPAIAGGTPAGLFVCRGGRLLYANRGLAQLTGQSIEALTSEADDAVMAAPAGRVPRPFAEAVLTHLEAAERSGELRLELPGGEERWVQVEASRLADDGATVVGTVVDVTARKLAERTLADRASWFRSVAETTATAIFVYRDTFLYVNPACIELSGYSGEELAAMDPLELIHPDYREYAEHFRAARLAGEPAPEHYELLIIAGDSRERWIDLSAALIRFEGQPAILASAFDITDRKEAELALRKSEERLAMAQRAAGVITWDWNLLTDELVVSDGAERSLGLTAGEVPGTTGGFFETVVYPPDRERVMEAVRQAINGQRDYDVEHRFRAPDGTLRWFSQRGQAIRDESGWVVRMVGVSIDVTKRKEVELALRGSEERLRLMVEQTPAVLWTTDKELRFTSSVGSGLAGLGLEPNQVVGMAVAEYLGEEGSAATVLAAHQRALRGESVSYEQTLFDNVYQTHLEPLRDAEGRIAGTIGIALDVTEHRRAEDALYREKEQAHATLASIGDGIVRTDASGAVTSLNPVAEKLTGYTNTEAQGRPIEEIYRVVDEDSRKPLLNPVERCLRENRPVMLPGLRLLVARDGRELAIRDSASPIRGRDGEALGAVLAFKDVSAVHAMERQMSYLKSHDGLTGLLNRSELERRIDAALEAVAESGGDYALLHLDIDHFKALNDTYGHLAGDELLKRMARLLQSKLSDRDTAARVGADELAVLMADCPPAAARRRAEELRAALGELRFSWQGRNIEVGVSIGLVPELSGDSVSRLLIAADTACLLAKQRGRNMIHVYQHDDAAVAERSGEMRSIKRIYEALDEEGFQLFAQPIQPLGASDPGELICEVLIRMIDTDGGLVLPQTFIPTAERYRLISSIDRWVVRRSLEALAGWASLGGRRVTHLAINLSGESLNDASFLEYLHQQLEQTGVDPSRTLFEITETAAIANLDGAMRFISDLQDRGCRFVLDDFGSGMSSFAYLKNLPVNVLKIAREFVAGVAEPGIERTLVRSINQIGHALDLRTIAEGVEDEATLAVMKELELDYAQGNWIAKPQPLEFY